MKKLIIIFFIFTNPLFAQTIQPLTNYSFEDLVENENANHFVLEGCISLYSAITELTKKRYPEMANEFFEIANTLYPYGIISLSKTKKISYEEAEKFFFTNVNTLTNEYIDEMSKNGEKTSPLKFQLLQIQNPAQLFWMLIFHPTHQKMKREEF